ncbi:hypothetical protein [Lignipirellula cremea]|uniref:Uncharacterized protein n=1 Tax=Lignipirellula cremea TaxID=2528010 RepID=A0A518E0P9_9BACT|nr:hypothetical protein [Lignipirellula cremea]QDU97672.1 hypothetical protein Pla8534_55250 [Lignipirellula cremea]
MAGEHFDAYDSPDTRPAESTARPFVGVQFACCSVYCRVYRNRQADAYEGRCPRCAKPIRLKIGAGGVSSRFFTVH